MLYLSIAFFKKLKEFLKNLHLYIFNNKEEKIQNIAKTALIFDVKVTKKQEKAEGFST